MSTAWASRGPDMIHNWCADHACRPSSTINAGWEKGLRASGYTAARPACPDARDGAAVPLAQLHRRVQRTVGLAEELHVMHAEDLGGGPLFSLAQSNHLVTRGVAEAAGVPGRGYAVAHRSE